MVIRMWTGDPPKAAIVLGGMGLIPFVSLAGIVVVGPESFEADARSALAAYGALILSFLGGAHWGYCIASTPRDAESNSIRLVASVMPAIVAWAALLSPVSITLYGLACGLTAMLAFDIWSVSRGWSPEWYPKIRWPLTICAVTAIIAAAT
ncbi:MAG: DUF3429 domain-containing protein [Rhodospirillales bacterium]